MYSSRFVQRKICTVMEKLGLSHSKNSYKQLVTSENTKSLRVPKGYVALYVGKEGKRYEVPVKYLSIPTFQELILKSQPDELEIRIDGPIILACRPVIFDQLLKLAKEY